MGNTERGVEKVFTSGDSYYGDLLRGLPHGYGKYRWSDGTVYEGNWEKGKMTGKGRIEWPSGSVYEGEFSGGYFHGHGEFTGHEEGHDHCSYSGKWRMNSVHGFGRKEYPNSDVYEGSWKEGVREGSGEYVWSSGDTYMGTWKAGKMFGRGVIKWTNGDVFYGFWLGGSRHGPGFYRFCDGGYYFGNWTRGLKDGRGSFYPAGSKRPSVRKWYVSAGYDGREKLERLSSSSKKVTAFMSMEPRRLGQTRHKFSFDQELMLRDLIKELSFQDGVLKPLSNAGVDQSEVKDGRDTVFEREYMQGILMRERIMKSEKNSKKINGKNEFPAREVERSSRFSLFNQKESHYLMLNLQLGIRYAVGKITPVPAREARSADFEKQARMKMFFPRNGSRLTPPHYSRDFHWKDYCPMVFRNLRGMFKLDAADYMMSICGDDGLREISSPGKSGCIFFLSHDDKFVIKTLRRTEVKVLLKMLPDYYSHVDNYENTLITKFYGLHRVKLKYGRKVRFVVMGNMFYTELKIHRRYDLKGSTHGRSTNRDKISETTTLKDQDLSYEFYMDRSLRRKLFEQISLDCKFLVSQRIIDYSLLLGLHFRAPDHLKPVLQPDDHFSDGKSSLGELLIPPTGLLLVNHEPNSVSTVPGPHIRGSPLRAYSAGDREVDLLLPGTARLRIQLGVNMPAQASLKLSDNEQDPTDCELFEIYDVVLYLGVIDILQNYNVKKKLEHSYKSKYCDPMAISAVGPELYSRRFISFLEKVFPDSFS